MVALKGKTAMKIRMQWKTYNWCTIQEACKAKKQFQICRQYSRGATRLDGARGKKQLWRPHVRAWGLSEANVLHWRKHLWYCWDIRRPPQSQWFGAPIVIRRRGNCPFPPLVTPLQCNPWFRSRSAWYQGHEVRWRPEQEPNLAPPYLNMRSYGSKFTALKEVFVTLLEIFGAPRSHSAPP